MRRIIIKEEFKEDYITRAAGEKLRMIVMSACQHNEVVELDFLGLTVGSTSFFDEGIAKLSDEGWTKEMLQRFVVFKDLNKRDFAVMQRVCQYRGLVLS